MDNSDSSTLAPEKLVEEDLEDSLETLFSQKNSMKCECCHEVKGRDRFCSLDLHGDGPGRNYKEKPCKETAEWVLILSGICGCGREIINRPYYLCDSCADVWSGLAIHSEKL